jgi:hypothetical protein
MGSPSRVLLDNATAMESEQVVEFLQFDQPLLSKTGKPIDVYAPESAATRITGPGSRGRPPLKPGPPAKGLAPVKLPQHPGEGVVAYTACCLATTRAGCARSAPELPGTKKVPEKPSPARRKKGQPAIEDSPAIGTGS